MKTILHLAIGLLFAAAHCLRIHSETALDYKISPEDLVVIEVFGEKEFSKEFRVSQTGTINYFFLGEVKVAGKTTGQVREALTAELNRDYLVDPQVTVDVKEYRVREVFVNGQVNKPGSILLAGEQRLTILGALARAGGLMPRANPNKIKFTRPGQIEKEFSLEDLKKQKDPSKTIHLEEGDIIEVADKLF